MLVPRTHQEDATLILNNLLKEYDKTLRPDIGGEPLRLRFHFLPLHKTHKEQCFALHTLLSTLAAKYSARAQSQMLRLRHVCHVIHCFHAPSFCLAAMSHMKRSVTAPYRQREKSTSAGDWGWRGGGAGCPMAENRAVLGADQGPHFRPRIELSKMLIRGLLFWPSKELSVVLFRGPSSGQGQSCLWC